MADEPNKFTHIGVKEDTQKRIAILAKVSNGGQHMYDLVDRWAKEAWEEAKTAGVVTDAMLKPSVHWVTLDTTTKRKRNARGMKEVTA